MAIPFLIGEIIPDLTRGCALGLREIGFGQAEYPLKTGELGVGHGR